MQMVLPVCAFPGVMERMWRFYRKTAFAGSQQQTFKGIPVRIPVYDATGVSRDRGKRRDKKEERDEKVRR